MARGKEGKKSATKKQQTSKAEEAVQKPTDIVEPTTVVEQQVEEANVVSIVTEDASEDVAPAVVKEARPVAFDTPLECPKTVLPPLNSIIEVRTRVHSALTNLS